MSQHESWHWTHEPVPRKLRGMTDGDCPHNLYVEPDGDNHVGDVSGFAPPGDIHRVHNTADETAISIHVYGTDVTRIGSSDSGWPRSRTTMKTDSPR